MPLKDFMEVLPLICIMAAIGNVLHDTDPRYYYYSTKSLKLCICTHL